MTNHKINVGAYDYYLTKVRMLVNRFITGDTTDVETKF